MARASAAENAAIVAGTTVETYGSLTIPASTSAATVQDHRNQPVQRHASGIRQLPASWRILLERHRLGEELNNVLDNTIMKTFILILCLCLAATCADKPATIDSHSPF